MASKGFFHSVAKPTFIGYSAAGYDGKLDFRLRSEVGPLLEEGFCITSDSVQDLIETNLLAKETSAQSSSFLLFSEGGVPQAGFSFRFHYNMSYE